MTLATIALILSTSGSNAGLPQGLLSALCFVESSHRPAAINLDDNGSASIGLCQIKLETARLVGFKGTESDLQNQPKLNAMYAAKYLKKQLNRYHGNVPKAVAAYNAGTYYQKKNGMAANQYYVNKVFKAWSEKR
jgi:soluble lytic murein transglycosylase-like protein